MSLRPVQLTLLLLLALLVIGNPAAAASSRLDIGSYAPELLGPDVTGNWQDLADYKGKWVYIDFWATWCSPCMRKLPGVVDLHDELSNRPDFAVLSVSLDEENKKSQVNSVSSKYGIGFPVVFDGTGWYSENARNWGVESIPATFLIDPAGRVVARDVAPESVGDFIAESSFRQMEPIRIRGSEQILADSPTTGRRDRQDFQIKVDFIDNSQAVNFFQLNVAYAYRDRRGVLVESRARYRIEITLMPNARDFPYRADIRNQPFGRMEDIWLVYEPYIGAPASDQRLGNPVAVSVDLAQRLYQFNLPLPRDCVMIAYSLDLYDAEMNRYISNGIRRMESEH